MMLIKDKKIAIVGGGPGGLTLARLLQQQGAEVVVYERDADRDTRVQGGALDLHDDSGLAALREAGLLEAFKANYRPGADQLRIVDVQGDIIYDQHEHDVVAAFGNEHFRPEIDRGPLRDILLDSLNPGTVMYNSHIIAIERYDEGLKLKFQDGNVAFADLVIGADGANSKIRAAVTDVKPFFVGISAIEGNVYHAQQVSPNIHKLLKGGKIFAMGKEQTVLLSAKGDGDLGFLLGFKSDEFWFEQSGIDFNDITQVLAWFKTYFSGWDSSWQELFDNKDTKLILRPQYCMPLDQQWATQSDITLLGDAAHWMPPYAGEGVNMAMLDALELSRCLTSGIYSSLKEAIAHYEKDMLKRFAEIGAKTLESTQMLHAPNAIENMMAFIGIQ